MDLDQNLIRKALKLAKIEDNDFSYQDISQMLQVKVGSIYNWLNGSFQLSQKKARYLKNWLADKGFI